MLGPPIVVACMENKCWHVDRVAIDRPCYTYFQFPLDCVKFGEELDHPLFYVSPIVELSEKPHLPVFNFQISPPGTPNPRSAA